MTKRKERPVDKAVRLAGGQTALAKHVGISRQAVEQWVKKGRIGLTNCYAVANHTGMTLTELRPDIYRK